jgi:hypothetical protein
MDAKKMLSPCPPVPSQNGKGEMRSCFFGHATCIIAKFLLPLHNDAEKREAITLEYKYATTKKYSQEVPESAQRRADGKVMGAIPRLLPERGHTGQHT